MYCDIISQMSFICEATDDRNLSGFIDFTIKKMDKGSFPLRPNRGNIEKGGGEIYPGKALRRLSTICEPLFVVVFEVNITRR